jgi:hypothetical protein
MLGFKSLVLRAQSGSEDATIELIAIMQLFQRVVSELDKTIDWSAVTNEMVPKSAQLSDTLVLVAPLTVVGKPFYNGLEIVAMRCIQIVHIALAHCFLVRGAIDVGPLFRVGANIARTPFIKAARLEKKTKQPRFVLSESANAWWTAHGTCHSYAKGNRRSPSRSNMHTSASGCSRNNAQR